jgi:hypothetical protein
MIWKIPLAWFAAPTETRIPAHFGMTAQTPEVKAKRSVNRTETKRSQQP